MQTKTASVGLAFALALGAQAATEIREVSTPKELYDALVEFHDSDGGPSTRIIKVAPGNYDVSDYEMTAVAGSQTAHLNAAYVTVRGTGESPRDTVIYGNRTKRIFYSETSHLENMTISNGYITANFGPGVLGRDSWSQCNNCVITCNEGSGCDNGGVAYVTCTDCEVCYNKAKHGGGASHLQFTRGSIHDNEASVSGGGGLSVTAIGARVYNNKAARGGGLSANYAVTVRDSFIYDNLATSTSSSDGGGGAFCFATNPKETFVFSNCVFYGNSAKYGGGVRSLKIIDCVISNNTATYGGGLYDVNGFDSLICSNKASYGAGIESSVVSNCTILGNIGTAYGAGAYSSTLTDSRVLRNLLDPGDGKTRVDGAGLYGGTATGCTIEGNAGVNTSGNSFGGGAYDSTLVNCAIRKNYAQYGGALHFGKMTGCTVSGNISKDGACTIRCLTSAERCLLDVQNMMGPGTLVGCTITGGGAAVTLLPGENAYTNGTFNSTGNLIENGQQPYLQATNCVFTGNRSWKFIYAPASAPVSLVNCTIADNKIAYTAEAAKGSASVEWVNCIFSGNKNYAGNAKLDFTCDATCVNNDLRNCLIETPPAAAITFRTYENIITNTAAGFSGDSEHPYTLRANSPARKKGLVMDWMTDEATDLRGEGHPRLCYGLCDIGAYQYWYERTGLLLLVK